MSMQEAAVQDSAGTAVLEPWLDNGGGLQMQQRSLNIST